jgi:hypothetical protein
MYLAEHTLVATSETSALTAVRAACALIPPLYDLENFVAVNPFLGWSKTPLDEASEKIAAGLDAEVLPKIAFYRTQWENQKLDTRDITEAALRRGLDPQEVINALSRRGTNLPTLESQVQLEAERVLNENGVDLPKLIRRFVSRTLAALCSSRATHKAFPISPNQVYQEIIERAAIDRTFELAGVHGWRAWFRSAPSDYFEAINGDHPKRQSDLTEEYAYRLLGTQYGWASYLRGIGWNSSANDLAFVEALCAALLVLDRAISELMPAKAFFAAHPRLSQRDQSIRLCLQDAYEDRLIKTQLATFTGRNSGPPSCRPDFQLVFCIDVRSEVFRRKLEALSPKIETVGFAGFFGVAVDLVSEGQSSPRCPVLVNPPIELKGKRSNTLDTFTPALRMAFSSPGAFNLIEALGLGAIGTLLSKGTGLHRKVQSDEVSLARQRYRENRFGLTLAERVGLAESILTNSGIGRRLGQVVVLCGHGGRSSNNAHAASLDCGACGGHCGAMNAQMATELLNDPEVRAELERRGFVGISGSLFVAGRHDTSTDEVSLFQAGQISEAHDRMVAELRGMLLAASQSCREERAREMGIEGHNGLDIFADMDRRANDWSEVRPEWGLALNASFIAARRFRTRGANLEGRAFLHDYDVARDTDDSILKLILSAPVIVASWINLQYFASTVNNERFGCGTKALLNRIGKVGVISGNEGDLRPGLPVESVHRPDGTWFHDPVRLQVIVEASPEKLDRALSQVPDFADLVRNGWLRLFALDPDSDSVYLKERAGSWEPF